VLHRGRVEHHVDAVEGPKQPLSIPYIADEEAELRALELLLHRVVFLLVAREDDHLARRKFGEQSAHHGAPEGPGPTRDQDHLVVQRG
jgi:hypothetical protein